MKVYNKLRLVLYRIQLKKVYSDIPKSIFASAVYPLKHTNYVNTSSKSILETAVYDRSMHNDYMKRRNSEIEKSRRKILKIESKIDRLK